VLEYQNNNFEKALEMFQKAQSTGIQNPDLYYNIANTYYKLYEQKSKIPETLPNAIIYYKKALLLDSSYQPAKDNLNFVLSVTRDQQIDEEENFMTTLIENTYYFFSINALLIICLAILVLIVLLIHIQWRFVADRTVLRFVNFVLLFIFLCVGGVTFSRIYQVQNNSEAVIVENTVYVFSGPSESFTRLFTIHEGTVMKIHKQELGWTQISTLSGYSGWIKADTFKRVQ
jgi:uncharacterized protein YgiM (DUF1202 family)